tara:strand:+ start:6668 stop:7006 length:339 start_codon:yes stop_codon:yes gene_type:complete
MNNEKVNKLVDIILKESELDQLTGQDDIRIYVLNAVENMYARLFERNFSICNNLDKPQTDAYGKPIVRRYSANQDRLHANAHMQRNKMLELGIDVIAQECRADLDSRYKKVS